MTTDLAPSTAAAVAAAASGSGAGALALAVLALAAAYLAACAMWPFAACRLCGGRGRIPSPSGRAWRICRWCKGTGGRLRAGRRLWTALRNQQQKGNR